MKPPFLRTCVPHAGVAPGNRAALIKQEEFMSLERAMEAPLADGYALQTITDFEGAIVYPFPTA